jgi:hypothetical protein
MQRDGKAEAKERRLGEKSAERKCDLEAFYVAAEAATHKDGQVRRLFWDFVPNAYALG